MYGEIFLAVICVALIVVATIGAIVILLERDRRKKPIEARGKSVTDPNPVRAKQKNWILPIIIALILAIWSINLALFLLLIVWIVRLNPKEKLSTIVTEEDRKICATNHRWLRNSAFITIPVFFVALFLDTPPAIAALIPFIFHISLMNRLRTKSLYVYRHTQQSLLLLLLRAATAGIVFSMLFIAEGFWPFIFINGSLWLFGTNWEVSQVTRNESWLMRRNGEAIIVSETQVAEKSPTEDEFEDLIKSLNVEGNTLRQKALRAFQTGTPEIRKKAVLILSRLGEVEKF